MCSIIFQRIQIFVLDETKCSNYLFSTMTILFSKHIMFVVSSSISDLTRYVIATDQSRRGTDGSHGIIYIIFYIICQFQRIRHRNDSIYRDQNVSALSVFQCLFVCLNRFIYVQGIHESKYKYISQSTYKYKRTQR